LFRESLLNDNYFFGYAFKFEVHSSIKKILSSVWMKFIFEKIKLFSDDISNMCSYA